ncbi:MAG: aminoglycoside 3'-phosphotransferase [Ruminococcaceae bacterium]|nr:aminoglycoside 3'-phosphotransferase [Oscillospiraceae bacterium]
MYIPERIKNLVGDKPFTLDRTGMSGSTVMCFDYMVLKIEKQSVESDNEHIMMQWLQGRLPVPEVICSHTENGTNYLLMTRAKGKMLCDESVMTQPKLLAKLVADTLNMLWQVDITNCPSIRTLDSKLALARRQVELGLCDISNAEPDTFGDDGFASPEHLLRWLETNRPDCKAVFSHGDLCLPNIFADNGRVSCFIDLGRSGIADPYQDIALGYRSILHNCDGTYGPVYEGFKPEMLFSELGIRPDWDKIRYYILLDELF